MKYIFVMIAVIGMVTSIEAREVGRLHIITPTIEDEIRRPDNPSLPKPFSPIVDLTTIVALKPENEVKLPKNSLSLGGLFLSVVDTEGCRSEIPLPSIPMYGMLVGSLSDLLSQLGVSELSSAKKPSKSPDELRAMWCMRPHV